MNDPTPVADAQGAALDLDFGFRFEDLYDGEALRRLDGIFLDFLGAGDAALRDRLVAARTDPAALPPKAHSQLLVDLAPHLDDFVAKLFRIEDAVRTLAARHHELAPLHSCKRLFVQRRAANKVAPEIAAAVDGPATEARLAALFAEPFTELAFAKHVTEWLKDEPAHAAEIGRASCRERVLYTV